MCSSVQYLKLGISAYSSPDCCSFICSILLMGNPLVCSTSGLTRLKTEMFPVAISFSTISSTWLEVGTIANITLIYSLNINYVHTLFQIPCKYPHRWLSNLYPSRVRLRNTPVIVLPCRALVLLWVDAVQWPPRACFLLFHAGPCPGTLASPVVHLLHSSDLCHSPSSCSSCEFSVLPL